MLFRNRRVGIQAHRGYSGLYPENTLLAFTKAIEAGADQIETDIRMTKDSVVCMLHDASVDRTTDGHGTLADLSLAEVRGLDAGRWRGEAFAGELIPTLEETLDLVDGKVRLNIEIKMKEQDTSVWQLALEKAVVAVTERNMEESVLFSSFQPETIRWVKHLDPKIKVGLLDWDLAPLRDKQQLVVDMGGEGWFPHPRLATPERVEQAHARGLIVISGGGNDSANREASVNALVKAGVDYISTNCPKEVIDVLDNSY